MATFNYPFTVASNEPMQSFGILDRSGTPIQNPFRGFANLFDADPNTPGVQIFNTNPNRNVTSNQNITNTNVSNSIPTASSFSSSNLPRARRSLLRDSFSYQNPFRGDEMTGSFQNVGNNVTSRFGGNTMANPTYPNASILNQRARVQNNQNNTGLFSVPNTEQEYLKASGLLNQQGQQRQTNQEPKQKGLLQRAFDKAVDFASSDYGRDFFAGIDAGYSKMPKTFMQSIQPGIQYADAKQQQKVENEINKLKAGKQNYREPVYRGLVIDKNGNEYGYFSSKGGMYAEINGAKVPSKDIKKVLGDYEIRNIGQQTFGLANFKEMQNIEGNLLNNERSLQSYERYLGLQGDTNQGIRRLADQYSTIFKTFFGEGLTEQELATKVANGELQRLIGASRKNIVGGGVMTEQDALRIIDALGGNVDSLQSPQAVRRAISQMFKETYDEYKINLRQYNYNVDKEYGNAGYERKKPIEFTKEQLKIFTSDITTGLGLLEYEDLTDDELLSIDPTTLNEEKFNEYFEERNKRGLVAK